MNSKSIIKCHNCEYENSVDMSEKRGAYFWTCENCGIECIMTASYSIEDSMNRGKLREYTYKKNTFCNLYIKYTGIKDIPKLKKYKRELENISNIELVKQLQSNNGLTVRNISLLIAEHEKENIENLGLTAKIELIPKSRILQFLKKFIL